jgi:hypothetical protein
VKRSTNPRDLVKNKSLCANNDDSSGDIDSDSFFEDKVNEFMLMDNEDYDNKIT